jgi:hypothetical protein
MKRRDFLTTTAKVAAGAALFSSPLGAAIPNKSKKRIALLNLSGFAI